MAVRERLESLIRGGAGHHFPVTLDFDNTILCGDIGEATLAILIRRGVSIRSASHQPLVQASDKRVAP